MPKIRLTMRVKALLLLGAGFIVVSTAVTFMADRLMTAKANEVQAQLFAERLDSITTALQRKQDILSKTGQEDAYRRAFQEAALHDLATKYYSTTPLPKSYPFILDDKGAVIMHPMLAIGDVSLAKLEFVKQIIAAKEGNLEYENQGEASFCMFTTFQPWGWTLVYSIPLAKKYQEVREFQGTFLVTLWIAGVAVLAAMFGLISLVTRPIRQLTLAASRMAAGDLTQEVDTTSRDEVGALAKSFAGMRDAIRSKIESLDHEIAKRQRTQEELFELNRTLEVRVEARTKALTLAKERLEAEISQRMQAEETMREAKKQAEAASVAKSDFLANMSHEIRTPMNGVLGMTELLLRTPLAPDQRDYAESVARCGSSLLTILNDILDFSKIEAGKLRFEAIAFDLPTLVFDVVELYRSVIERDVDLLVDVDPSVPARLVGDPSRLRQLLSNLVSNAVRFTSAGHVLLSTRLMGLEPLTARLQIAVEDTGIGISADDQLRLFQPFSQVDSSTSRKYGGTGLGLVLCKRIAEAMGGSIALQSSEGKGSVFTVSLALPIHPEHADRSPPPSSLKAAQILIVDDNDLNRRIIEKQLAPLGTLTTQASSGGKALELIYHALGDGPAFDAVIIDFHMPGMTGESVGRALRGDIRLSRLGVLMLTSSGQPEELGRMAKTGFDAYLLKPVRGEVLIQTLALVIDRKREGKSGEMITRHTIGELSSRASSDPILSAPLRVLLAEDNMTNQLVARGILESMGATVELASDGVEALEAISRSTFDVILMDCQMPHMDGLTATARIRANEAKNGGRIPIVAMTANAMDGDREDCIAAGMDDYLSKPVSRQALWKVLSNYDGKTGASGAGTTAMPQPEAATVDHERFRYTESLLKEIDGGFHSGVLDPFLDDAEKRLTEIEVALKARDGAALRSQTHAIKGAAQNLGFVGLALAAENLEAKAGQSSFEDAQASWLALRSELDKTRAFIAAQRP